MDSIESLVSQGMSGSTLLPAGGRQRSQGHGSMSEFLVGLAVLTPSHLHRPAALKSMGFCGCFNGLGD